MVYIYRKAKWREGGLKWRNMNGERKKERPFGIWEPVADYGDVEAFRRKKGLGVVMKTFMRSEFDTAIDCICIAEVLWKVFLFSNFHEHLLT